MLFQKTRQNHHKMLTHNGFNNEHFIGTQIIKPWEKMLILMEECTSLKCFTDDILWGQEKRE